MDRIQFKHFPKFHKQARSKHEMRVQCEQNQAWGRTRAGTQIQVAS
jgi:hypothetical protein